MKTVVITLYSLFLVISGSLYAQDPEPVSLKRIFVTMPIPGSSLKEMMEDNTKNETIEKRFTSAFTMINEQIDLLYQPVYERFRKVNENPGLFRLTSAEQAMRTNVNLGARGLTASSKFHFFRLQMSNRLPVGNSRPMWAFQTPDDKSPGVQKVYQEIRMIETGFQWATFISTAERHVLQLGSTNKRLEAINTKFDEELKNLPKKQISLFGFTQETPDPEKAIELCKNYGHQREKAFEEEYANIYRWWNQQYQELQNIVDRTDTIALDLISMNGQSRDSIQQVLIDLQIRTLEALYKLTAVAQRLYNDRLIGLIGEEQIKEMISLYEQYQAAS